MNNPRWYRWSEKLPPFDTKLWFYSERLNRVVKTHWSYPTCCNHEEVIQELKSGQSTSYGIHNLDHATHWYSKPPEPPPPPPANQCLHEVDSTKLDQLPIKCKKCNKILSV